MHTRDTPGVSRSGDQDDMSLGPTGHLLHKDTIPRLETKQIYLIIHKNKYREAANEKTK